MADTLLMRYDAMIAAKFALVLWSMAAVASFVSEMMPGAADTLHMVALLSAVFGGLCMAAYLAGIVSAQNLLDPVMLEIEYISFDDMRQAGTGHRGGMSRNNDDDPQKKWVRVYDPDVLWVSMRGVKELFVENDNCLVMLSEVESDVVVLVSGRNVTIGYPADAVDYVEITEQNYSVTRMEL